MSQSFVAEALKPVLASHYLLYLKTQNYHWNVTGSAFYVLHQAFEEQYQELALAIDALAERIRALGERAPASFGIYTTLSAITDGDMHADAMHMLQDLADSHVLLMGDVERALEVATSARDEASAHLLTDRLMTHQTVLWKLRSMMA